MNDYEILMITIGILTLLMAFMNAILSLLKYIDSHSQKR